MKLRAVVLIALSTLLAHDVSFALDNSADNRKLQAERYLEAAPPRKLFEEMVEQMSATVAPSQRASFRQMMTKELNFTAVEALIRAALVKHFTADELKALADFYGSPVGKSAMAKFGPFTGEIMPAIQAEVDKAAAKVNSSQSAASSR